MKKIIYAIFLILAVTTSVQAQLIVVEDMGGTSALPYYEAIGITPEKPIPNASTRPVARVDESFSLPIHSSRLSPGLIEPRRMETPGLMPFFLVGADELSRRWLKERGEVLRELGAFGLVVEVASMDELEELRQLAPGLVLSPVPGDDLAERLQLSSYPVLITSTGIDQ